MKITKISPVTGKDNTMDLPITQDQLTSWAAGVLIQDAMPNLTPDQREFLMTGCTPGDWNVLFGPG